ncbi:MAG: 50S ribosomal protein L22 [Candidatus Thermofonsia Clade 1 bacterium]|jgi:large subunit ribosomal protein L22|uniref:Large ribosomal subunit protein uL22 n=1 Tax=Candidatus Thermofonsia Clade 1 bacterium TaxID=2364210 RepID=A0A2M8PYJ5_9CHLR|nr:MAG: 50S ribosomal protein L22 [Candidatus Thermofonsia Clade 1 bacterium]PJF42628.1 MAG: 50S ribosomal protein L22 [Candidatus Thermofonsia Clade 1 bacterium]RMF51628.1 MAG: 50S ribosomal protein L22 [Chloroflexota bacterium]
MPEVFARARSLPISPQKIRLVCDQVRGRNVDQALVLLQHMPQKGAAMVRKLVVSAIANAENNNELNRTDLYIKAIYADESFRLKRVKAGARGRYKPRVRRYSHVTVILDERES